MATTEHMIEVMQAYLDGKQIQCSSGPYGWIDIENPLWSWDEVNYRIKPDAQSKSNIEMTDLEGAIRTITREYAARGTFIDDSAIGVILNAVATGALVPADPETKPDDAE